MKNVIHFKLNTCIQASKEMESLNRSELRQECSKVIEELDFLIEVMEIKKEKSFNESVPKINAIKYELFALSGKVYNLISASPNFVDETESIRIARKYDKIAHKLNEVRQKLELDLNEICKYEEKKIREKKIDYFKKLSKELKKICESI